MSGRLRTAQRMTTSAFAAIVTVGIDGELAPFDGLIRKVKLPPSATTASGSVWEVGDAQQQFILHGQINVDGDDRAR